MGMKNLFLRTFIASLVAVGAFGIFALSVGRFGEFEIKVLITTLAFTVYSLTGLCCSSLGKSRYRVLAILGVTVAVMGLIYATATTWFVPKDFGVLLKGRLVFLIVSIAFAHACLLLLIAPRNSGVTVVRSIAILANVVSSLLLISMVANVDVAYLKLLGIVAIVGVVSTISTPILNAVSKANAG